MNTKCRWENENDDGTRPTRSFQPQHLHRCGFIVALRASFHFVPPLRRSRDANVHMIHSCMPDTQVVPHLQEVAIDGTAAAVKMSGGTTLLPARTSSVWAMKARRCQHGVADSHGLLQDQGLLASFPFLPLLPRHHQSWLFYCCLSPARFDGRPRASQPCSTLRRVMAWNGLGNVCSLSFGHQESSTASAGIFDPSLRSMRVALEQAASTGRNAPKRNRRNYYPASRQFGILSTALWRFCKKPRSRSHPAGRRQHCGGPASSSSKVAAVGRRSS
jgi:hypothetical protein